MNERYELHGGIDVSDGLSIDLGHMAKESGWGAVVQTEAVPITADAAKLGDGSTPLDHALSDGEDFELILAVPPAEAQRMLADSTLGVRLTDIGEFILAPGLWQREGRGEKRPLEPRLGTRLIAGWSLCRVRFPAAVCRQPG